MQDVIFWPGIASEIWHLASQCSTYSDYKAKQQKEPLLSQELPTAPWTIVAHDILFAGKSYLITADYYSDFWQLDAVIDTSSETIVEHTKAHFAHYGITIKVITDNRPQFRAQVCCPMGIQSHHKFSIPQLEQWQGRSNSKNCQKHAEESDPRPPGHEPGNTCMVQHSNRRRASQSSAKTAIIKNVYTTPNELPKPEILNVEDRKPNSNITAQQKNSQLWQYDKLSEFSQLITRSNGGRVQSYRKLVIAPI